MKKYLRVTAICLIALSMISCASTKAKPGTSEAPEVTKASEEKEVKKMSGEHPFGIDDETYSEILDKSVVSLGNNYRMKKVIEKLRSGDDVYVACLGGSVTEGAGPKDASGKELFKLGYAYQFHKKLGEAFTPNNGANVHFCGAGLSGTPSTLGLTRYNQDIVQVLGHDPDILVIEFCVNDGGEPKYAKAHEELIREALTANPETCVIELYSDAKSYKNSQQNIIPVATYYRLPQVSIQDTVESHITVIDEGKFFADYVHPQKEGHEIMADCLMNLFYKADLAKSAEPYEIPSDTIKNPSYSNFKQILGDDENVKIVKGGFASIDPKTQTLKKTGKGDFPINWKKPSNTEGDSMTIQLNCKAFIFTYKNQGSWEQEKYGTAEVYVDGKLVKKFNGGANGGWNNCLAEVLFEEETASDHTIEIKMAEQDKKLGFTIVAMGYAK